FKNNLLKYILLSIGLIAVVSLKWLAVPVIFAIYILLSLFSKEPDIIIVPDNNRDKEMTDVTA
ncbi:MAG: hypothetical protein C4329_15565, partial [Chitinophagaceae bacterium]